MLEFWLDVNLMAENADKILIAYVFI